MRKTRLNPEELVVTSFEVAEKGGVRAMEAPETYSCRCETQPEGGCEPNPSYHCSLDKPCLETYYGACVTNAYSPC